MHGLPAKCLAGVGRVFFSVVVPRKVHHGSDADERVTGLCPRLPRREVEQRQQAQGGSVIALRLWESEIAQNSDGVSDLVFFGHSAPLPVDQLDPARGTVVFEPIDQVPQAQSYPGI